MLLWRATASASSAQGHEGCAAMMVSVGKVGRQMVEVDRPRVVESLAAAAGRTGAGGHHAGVKQHRDVQAGGGVEELRKAPVVGIELLPARVELGALEAQLAHRPLELAHRQLALPRVDAAEADEDVGVLATRRGQLVVGIRRYAGGGLGVGAEQHRQDVELR